MKELTSHIDFLMQKHDCVIIPDFGGFVLHREPASVEANGSIAPPRVSVGFNPELNYNDGLLAESYMNAYSVSYDVAFARLSESVRKMNVVLGLFQPISIGQLGTLQLNEDGVYNFTPNSLFTAYHPETFGLGYLDVKRLTEIRQIEAVVAVSNQKTFYKRVFTGISASAAAVLVFFMSSTPILENSAQNIQKSGFFIDVNKPATEVIAQPRVEEQEVVKPAVVPVKVVPVEVPKVESPKKEIVQTNSLSEIKYYVIIGSSANKSEAQVAMKQFKTEGLSSAQVLPSGSRMRIYVASFENKAEAERYKSEFVRKNPRLSDAWIHVQKN